MATGGRRLRATLVAVPVSMALAAGCLPAADLLGPLLSTALNAQEVGWEKALINTALSEFFGIKDTELQTVLSNKDMAPKELPVALATSRMAGVDIGRIMALRKRGQGWGQIAHAIGMHPGQFNKLRKRFGIDDKAKSKSPVPWIRLVGEYFRLDVAKVERSADAGHAAGDILMAANLSARSGQELGRILAQRKARTGWQEIAANLGVDGKSLSVLPPPKGRFSEAGRRPGDDKSTPATAEEGPPSKEDKEHGKRHGKGRGHKG